MYPSNSPISLTQDKSYTYQCHSKPTGFCFHSPPPLWWTGLFWAHYLVSLHLVLLLPIIYISTLPRFFLTVTYPDPRRCHSPACPLSQTWNNQEWKFHQTHLGRRKQSIITKVKGMTRSRNEKRKKWPRTLQLAQVVRFTGISNCTEL